jgi:hypothetical protein
VNNQALTGASVTTLPAGSTSATSAIVQLAAPLAAGDVITATNAIKTADGRAIANTSVTVASDTSKPTATILPFVGKNVAWVTFSEPITTSTFDGSDLTLSTGGNLAGATVAFFNAADSGHASVAKVTQAGTFASNVVVSLAAATYKDAAGLDNNASSGTATNDTSPPTASSAKFTTVAATQAAKSTTGTGKITVTAKKGAAADGIVGNSWTLAVTNAEAAPSVAVNTGAKTITVFADLDGSTAGQPTASSVVNALNASSAFSALFTATVEATSTGGAAFDAALGATPLTGGSNATTITLTFSEAVDPSTATAGNFGLDVDGNGTQDVAIGNASATAFQNGVVVLSITQTGNATELPIAGTSKVLISTGVTDLAGNANAAQTSATLSA